jgi:hypothetical protein
MSSLDLKGLSRFTDFSGTPPDAFCNILAEKGKQYALYIFHGAYEGDWGANFIPDPGNYLDTLILNNIPAGDYFLEWIDPSSGSVKTTEKLNFKGGDQIIKTPGYSMDMALRMRKK